MGWYNGAWTPKEGWQSSNGTNGQWGKRWHNSAKGTVQCDCGAWIYRRNLARAGGWCIKCGERPQGAQQRQGQGADHNNSKGGPTAHDGATKLAGLLEAIKTQTKGQGPELQGAIEQLENVCKQHTKAKHDFFESGVVKAAAKERQCDDRFQEAMYKLFTIQAAEAQATKEAQAAAKDLEQARDAKAEAVAAAAKAAPTKSERAKDDRATYINLGPWLDSQEVKIQLDLGEFFDCQEEELTAEELQEIESQKEIFIKTCTEGLQSIAEGIKQKFAKAKDDQTQARSKRKRTGEAEDGQKDQAQEDSHMGDAETAAAQPPPGKEGKGGGAADQGKKKPHPDAVGGRTYDSPDNAEAFRKFLEGQGHKFRAAARTELDADKVGGSRPKAEGNPGAQQTKGP